MRKLKDVILLFLVFFKIGLFTFGGGYAMIALIEREIVERKKWIDKESFLDIIAIAESTPGPIAINSATYIGYKRRGVLGSVFATLGVSLPSFIIILIISFFFEKFLQLKYVEYAFRGIAACVSFLIISAGIKMFKGLKKNFFNLLFFFLTAITLFVFDILAIKFSSVYFILIGAFIGLILYLFTLLSNKKGGGK